MCKRQTNVGWERTGDVGLSSRDRMEAEDVS